MKRIPALLLILVAISALSASAAQPPRYLELTLISTNDLHDYLVSRTRFADTRFDVSELKNACGAARRAEVIREIRSKAKGPVLLTDSGDTTFGWSAFTQAFRGRPDIEIMNELRYNAAAPGNHDFEWADPSDLLRNIRNSHFPWVCANVVDKQTGKLFLPPYVIQDVEGVRVAFVGLMTITANDNPMWKCFSSLGLKVIDPIETTKNLMPELRKQADVVIILSHLGIYQDDVLATVPGVDVILGGHSHALYLKPKMVQVGEPSAFNIAQVPNITAHCYGDYLAKLHLIFHRDGATGRYTLMNCDGEAIQIDSSIPDDPQIARIVRKYQVRLPKPKN